MPSIPISKAKRISRSVCSSPRVGLKKVCLLLIENFKVQGKGFVYAWGVRTAAATDSQCIKGRILGDNTYDYERQLT
ncbi:protein NLP4-like [Gossypium australe]|uniref:Protein NLP4-like n=1 Tax=Gossypium australe TaxID=47621 RepID=A0A5B6X8H5_9ROSI|nr:protein NLP4-like [Gossypium australe]